MPRLPITKGLDNILLILMQVLTLFEVFPNTKQFWN